MNATIYTKRLFKPFPAGFTQHAAFPNEERERERERDRKGEKKKRSR